MASLSGLSAVGAWRRLIGEPEKPPCQRAQRMADQQATLRKTIADAAGRHHMTRPCDQADAIGPRSSGDDPEAYRM